MSIEVKDLSFAYGEHEVLHGVSFKAKAGEFLSILGPNGVGKSTLFRCVLGLLRDYKGSITVEGRDAKSLSIRETAKLIAYIPQSSHPAFNYSVRDIVLMGTTSGLGTFSTPKKEDLRRVDEALRTVGMYEYRLHAPHLLSGGQKQRVAIAGVIAMRPDCLVLDEATAMLDPIGREKVMRTVHRLNDDYGITVVQITHYMEEAATADRVVVMSAGRVVMEGTPKEVFRNVEELRALHLDVPQAAELCHALTAAGCPMADDIIDVEECAAALYELLTGKKAPGAAQEKAEEVSACPQS